MYKRQYNGRPFDPEKDTILNSVYQQAQSAKMMGGDYMNDIAEEDKTDADKEIDKLFLEKSINGNPILGTALEFIDKQLGRRS